MLIIESRELQVYLFKLRDYKQNYQYKVVYGFQEALFDNLKEALSEFSDCCYHSAACESWEGTEL